MILRAIPATDEWKRDLPIEIMAFGPRVLLVRHVIGIFYIDSNMHVGLSYSYQLLAMMPCILAIGCWNFYSIWCQWMRYNDHKWISYNLHLLYMRKLLLTYMWIWLFKSTFILLQYPLIMGWNTLWRSMFCFTYDYKCVTDSGPINFCGSLSPPLSLITQNSFITIIVIIIICCCCYRKTDILGPAFFL